MFVIVILVHEDNAADTSNAAIHVDYVRMRYDDCSERLNE